MPGRRRWARIRLTEAADHVRAVDVQPADRRAQRPVRPDPRRRQWCSCSPASRSTPSPGPPAPSCSRCGASSASTPGSWTTPRSPSTAASSTSAPRTRCASWPPPACWRRWHPSRSGFGLGIGPLAGYLAGAIGTGVLMAVFLANSGGSWDNAKKIVEDGALRRQGLRGARGDRHRRHRRRPVQGHRRPGDQPADQGDEPRLGAHRPGHRAAERGPGRQHDAALRHRRGGAADRGRRHRDLQAARPGHRR